MKLALFASFCFVIYISCGNDLVTNVRADVVTGSRSGHQHQSGQEQSLDLGTHPFWAARGRRSGEPGPFNIDNGILTTSGVEPIEDYENSNIDREVIPRPRPFAETAYYWQRQPNLQLVPRLTHSLQDNTMKAPTYDDAVIKPKRFPTEPYLATGNDPTYYVWYNVKKSTNSNPPLPDLPFWAARG